MVADPDVILEFVRALVGPEVLSQVDIGSDTPLIGSQLIDSFNVLEIVSFLEERFSVVIDSSSITEENFDSVNTIAAVVDRMKSRRVG
jgi:acyl carrier protein